MGSLADVLVGILHLLPIREESQLSTYLQIIEEARPALESLVTAAKDAEDKVKSGVEHAVTDAENVVKGL